VEEQRSQGRGAELDEKGSMGSGSGCGSDTFPPVFARTLLLGGGRLSSECGNERENG
jgi:hypothetical protein